MPPRPIPWHLIHSSRGLAYYFWKLQARMVKEEYKLLRYRRLTPLR